jgi:hypothetical protein
MVDAAADTIRADVSRGLALSIVASGAVDLGGM